MSARSTQIFIANMTGMDLTLTDNNLDHGIWDGGPAQTVPANNFWVVGQNDSDGMMTGAQGSVTYNNGIGTLTLSWDNPYAGANSGSVSYTPNTGQRNLNVVYVVGYGDNSQAVAVLTESWPQ